MVDRKDKIKKIQVTDPPLNPQISLATDEKEEKHPFPLDGQWMPYPDATTIGKDFSVMTNMRYTEKHPETILGMSQISDRHTLPYLKARSAFHFRKTQPVESHVLSQQWDSGLTAAKVYQNVAAVPTAWGDNVAELWTDSAGAGIAAWSDAPNGQVAYCNGVDSCIWSGDEMALGGFVTSSAALSGASDQPTNPIIFTDQVNNLLSDDLNVAVIGGTNAQLTFLVGSSRPIQGTKLYISTPNGTVSSLAVKTFNGTTWASLSITDDTAVGGVTLAKTGKVSWASTVGTSQLIYLQGELLYWYEFTITGAGSSAKIYHATLDIPFQGIVDVWDGTFRQIVYYNNDKQPIPTEDVLNVNSDDFIAADTTTYSIVENLGLTFYAEVGFNDKQTGLLFHIPPSPNANVTACTITIDYWDGFAYQTVGTVHDGTSVGGVSFAQSGVVSWYNAHLDGERKQTLANQPPLYYYRIGFSAALHGTATNAVLYHVGGISAGKQVKGYSFCINAADRLMLGCNNTLNKNELLISGELEPDVWSGADAYSILFGDDKALTCGTSIFAQYASNIYNMVIVFKASETWTMTWTQPTGGQITWERFMISPNVGCPAPGTLKVASVAFGKSVNETKVVAIWRADDGIYVSNGQAPVSVSHRQISNVFDQTKSLHVNLAMVGNENAFVDWHWMEYHWLWASNNSTTLDKEYVLDLNRWQWFEIDRTTGMRLQLGLDVEDNLGNRYSYGFIDAGYMALLEDGASFLGNPITSILRFGDDLLEKDDLLSEMRISRANLVTVAKNTESDITLTHFMDGASSGDDFAMSAASTKRYANTLTDIYSDPGTFHSFQFTVVSSQEKKGFEPLFFAVYKIKERDKTLNVGLP